MQIVYDRFETVELSLHKAFFHIEDFDPNVWEGLIEENKDDEESDSDPTESARFEFTSDHNIIITIVAEKDLARQHALKCFELLNLWYCFDHAEVDARELSSYANNICRFRKILDDSYLLAYIDGTSNILESKMESKITNEMGFEKTMEYMKGAINKNIGLERYLESQDIHVDSETLEEGEKIMIKGSNLDFILWLGKYYLEVNENSFQSNLIINSNCPQIGDSETYELGQNDSDETAPNNYMLFSQIVKAYEKEYRKWERQPYLQRQLSSIRCKIDEGRGRITLEWVFSHYYQYENNEIIEKMFYAMNSDICDYKLNKELVEAVRNHPDPHFAVQVNEHYNEYKKYNKNCIDFPFVDPTRYVEPQKIPVMDKNPIDLRLGKYIEISLSAEDVSSLYKCFYTKFEQPEPEKPSVESDLIYYLSQDSDDDRSHYGIYWQGSREGLALFLTRVLPPKKSGFWKNVYKVFRIKKNDKWGDTEDLNKIYSREWDTEDNSEECKKLESLYNNWMIRRPNLKGKWEFKDWHKKKKS